MSLQELHNIHNVNLNYKRGMKLFIESILKDRIQYIQRMCLVFVVTYHLFFLFLAVILNEYVPMVYVVVLFIHVAVTTIGTRLLQRMHIRKTMHEVDVPDIQSLGDSLFLCMLPLYVYRLKIDEKDIEKLGGLFSHKLAAGTKLKANTSWSDVGQKVAILAARLCLLKMFVRVTLNHK